MFFFREKMAFFTRTQMTVPFIPDDDNCPVEGTEGQTKTDGACDDKYVVSRSMGVEVWNHSSILSALKVDLILLVVSGLFLKL